jgi:general secretion pathway protein K
LKEEGTVKQGGFALVVVLWVVALLTVMAGGFALGMRTDTNLTYYQVASAKARALAEAGVNRGIMELLKQEEDRVWATDGSPNQLPLEDGALTISVQDESGKIDLNVAQTELLGGLLHALGVDDRARDALVDSILDWRDPDDLRRANGAEAADYKAAGLPYGPKNGPFDSVDELQQVLGMTPALFLRMRGFVTVYSQQGGINPLVAPRTVLLAVPGWDAAQVDSYMAMREQFSQGLPQSLPAGVPIQFVSGRSNLVYAIRSMGRTPQGATAVMQAVVRVTRTPQQPASIVSWKEGESLLPEEGSGDDGPA